MATLGHHRCRRKLLSVGTHLALLLATAMFVMTSSVGARRSYGRRVGLLRSSTDNLPTDPWQLFNISVTQTGNRTEGMQTMNNILLILFSRTCRVHGTRPGRICMKLGIGMGGPIAYVRI